MASGALRIILDSDEDGEQDDLSLDDNCKSINFSDESFEGEMPAPLHQVLLQNRLKGGQVHRY